MIEFSREQHMVAQSFQSGLSAFRQEPLVLYGIGKNTQAVLSLTDGFQIVGLLDQNPDNIGKEFYGKYVLSLEDAANVSKKIVIIARAAITPVIYSRIQKFTSENKISVYNYAGKLLDSEEEACGWFHPDDWEHTREALLEAVRQHDVISFDIFDTLLGRYVLQPQDVFSLVERDIHIQGHNIPFRKLRVQAEQECGYAASLEKIYARLAQNGIPQEECQNLMARELAWEKRVSFKRKSITDIFEYAKSLGKTVCLTSDMYLSKPDLEELLRRHGITGYHGLLISCEEHAEKSDGALFSHLLKRVSSKNVLHIGDNRYSDVEMAQRMGVDAWQLWSGYDLLVHSGLQKFLVEQQPELGERLALGMLIAKLFEDPFALHETQGKIVLTQPEEVGFCFLGPWAVSFMQWAADQVESHAIKTFYFPSRDGFLFFYLGQIMQQYGYMAHTRLKYVKASRRALITASLRGEEDLRKGIEGRPYYTGKGGVLQEWFGIEPDPLDEEQAEPVGNMESLWLYLRRYLQPIQKEAAWERQNYRRYFEREGLFVDQKTAVFDFVASGTVQYYLERQLGRKMLGLYCARMRKDEISGSKDSMKILTAFPDVEPYGSEGTLSQNYLAMEAVLVDGNRTLAYFNEVGEPVYQPENGFTYQEALEVQQYVCSFAKQYLALFGTEKISLKSAEKFLDILFSRSCRIKEPAANAFVHDDKSEITTQFKRRENEEG